MEGLTRFGVSLPAQLVEAFDASIHRKGYRTRSEAIGDMMRGHLVEEEWDEGREVIGTVTIVYEHESRELSGVLNELQHHESDIVVCATHVHVDAHNCLEVIVMKGQCGEVRALADRLISTRGVKHGRLVCTTTGAGLA
jgi:CopG family nickel-responsive transcriptional regulator